MKRSRNLKKLVLIAVQFHDDDVVPEKRSSDAAIKQKAKEVKKLLEDNGLEAEFVAPGCGWIPEQLMGFHFKPS